MTLGNHEFNWGIPTMQAILGQASFPVLAANVTGARASRSPARAGRLWSGAA